MHSALYPANNQLNDTQIDYEGNSIEKTIPTTEAQKEMWLACELGGIQANLAYNQSFTIQFEGRLQIKSLNKAINILVSRHEALRSVFSSNGQEFSVYKHLSIDIEQKDLSSMSAIMQKEHFDQFLHADSFKEFNLENGPLFRFIIHTFSEQEHRLTLTLHHIIADGWSINVLLKDLSKIYSAEVTGNQRILPPASQISDYVADEIEYKKSTASRETEEFWLNLVEKKPPSFEVPSDLPRKPERVYRSARIDAPIPNDLVDKIKEFGIQHQCSLPTVLISAFEVFLYQITFQKNTIIGLPTSGQVSQEKFGLVGHCANLLPLQSEIDPSDSFLRYLQNRRTALFDAYEHQTFTFGELIKKTQVKRDHSRATLVPVVLNIDTSFGNQVSFSGLQHKIISNPKSHEIFEIVLNISHSTYETLLEWTYNTELFFEETIKNYHDVFITILEKIVNNSLASINEIVHVSSDHLNYKPIESKLYDLFYSAVDQFEQHQAVTLDEESLTYQELNTLSNQFGNYLIQKGIKPGDCVGISHYRSINSIIALLGIIKIRACYVPIDATLPHERKNYIVQNAGIQLFLNERGLANHIAASQTYDSRNINNSADGDDLIYVLHTSGSTGVPKGVCLGNDALVNLLLWQVEESNMKPTSRTLQYSSLSFDASFLEIFATFLSGGELILIDDETRKDPKELLEYIEAYGVNRLYMPFVALQSLADTAITHKLFPKSLSELITAGEQLKVTEQVRQFFSQMQSCILSNQYGPTECHVVTELKLTGNPETWPYLPSIGKEITNTRIYILDDKLQEVLPGESGELCISGVSLAHGYLNQPDITDSKFITFVDQNGEHIRIYKTGDLAKRLPDGDIDFLGRLDFQVKIRGHRVELGEIEHHILAQKNMRDVVVICLKSPSGEQQLAAYYIKGEQRVESINIQKVLREYLPDYMIPQYFIEVPEFPKTSSGKIDRKKLAQVQPINIGSTEPIGHQSLDKIQEIVIAVWKQHLNVASLTLDSNFFEAGGHSLTAINVLIELEKQTGLRPKLTSIFKHPCLKDFAELYKSSDLKTGSEFDDNKPQPFNPNQDTIEAPILETQSEVWTASILGGDPANKAYNISSAHILKGDLNIEHFEAAIHFIVDRHESLRTTFNEDGSKMLVHRTTTVDIFHDDYSNLSQLEQEQKVLDYSLRISEAAFDLNSGNLFRFSLLKLSKDSYYFIFTVHHLICDGYSIDILLNELSIIYNQLRDKKEINLPAAPSLLDYATQKSKFYKSNDFVEIKRHWLQGMATKTVPLNLPYDFQRPNHKDYCGASVYAKIPRPLVNKIQEFSAKYQSSVSLTVKVLFELFFYQISKQTDFVTGQLSADQVHNGHDGLVGNCVNLLPVRSQIDPNLTFSQFFKTRKEELIENDNNQAITYGTLINELGLKQKRRSSEYISTVINIMLGMNDIKLTFVDIESEPYIFNSGTEKFNLTINVLGTEHNPTIEWNYSTQVFRKESIEKFINNFERLTDRILSESDIKVADLLDDHSDHENDYSERNSVGYKHATLVHDFQETARTHLDKVAVESEGKTLTYHELDQKSNQLAHYLRFKGIERGDVIAIAINRDIELMITLLGILKCGAVYLPLDPEYPTQRLHYMLTDSECKFAVISKGIDLQTSAVNLFDGFNWQMLDNFSTDQLNLKIDGQDLAYILYTSGSTGQPKGVQIRHKGLLNCLKSAQQQPGLTAGDRFMAITTISFDLAAIELFLPIVSGATVVIADSGVIKDSRRLLTSINKEAISVVQATPTTWKMLLQNNWDYHLPIKALSGGEPLSLDLAQSLLTRVDELWNVYGPTETTIWSSVKKINKDDRIITIGTPINNTEIYVLDENLRCVPHGSTGEIYIGGDGVAKGYLNKPTLNAEKFIANPFEAGIIYATGDLGYIETSGELICLGRKDSQVKIRGHRIELSEIEHILNQEADIKDVTVICNKPESDNPTLIAYIISTTESIDLTENYSLASDVEVERWKKALVQHLPSYMIPKLYVRVRCFPKTDNGKINRLKFPELSLDDFVENKGPVPQSENEVLVANMWSESLGLKHANLDDNFFDLGGNSLTAVRLMLKIEKQFNIKLPISILYSRPTIREIVLEIQQHECTKKWDLIVPIKETGSKKPLYLIHGLGLNVLGFEPLRKYMDENQPLYGVQALGLKGDITSVPNTLEEMAAIYAQEIIAHEPIGPYQIAGYSSGGVLAHEIARQISITGRSVSKLIVIDAQICGSRKSPNDPTLSRRRCNKIKFIMSSFFKYPIQSGRHHIKKFANKLKLTDYNEAYPDMPDEIENKELLTVHYRLFTKHQPKQINLDINLIRSKERVYFLNDGKTYGWKQYTTKQVRAWNTSGSHFTCFNHPNVESMARCLRAILSR